MILDRSENRLGRVRQVFGLLSTVGGLFKLDISELWSLVGQISAALQELGNAEGIVDYQRVAVRVLEPVAPLTETELDDGLLIGLRVLSESDEWNDWLQERVDERNADASAPPPGIPDGAMAFTFDDDVVAPLAQPRLEAIAMPGATVGGFAQLLPLIIELIRLFQSWADEDGQDSP